MIATNPRPWVNTDEQDSDDPGDYLTQAVCRQMYDDGDDPEYVAAYAYLTASLINSNNTPATFWEDVSHRPLLHCIFGNPFRPTNLNPDWITSTVESLARTIYEDRAFDRMPILADAMEEAGCDNAEILQHCREPGVHVRGCWVVDLLLCLK